MKRLLLAAILFLSVPLQMAYAHSPGQPPFLKINGTYTNFYPVPSTSLTDFNLPQDIAPGSYVVNVPVDIIIDTTKLPVPEYIIKQTKFSWDFGDGQNATGLTTTHTYNHIGSYIVSLTADDGTTPKAQLFDSFRIDIKPNSTYSLPHPILKVNGRTSTDPLTDIFKLSTAQPIFFDATASSGGGSKIISYQWDFGDGLTDTSPKISHAYTDTSPIVFPLIRIKDANGFFADTFVQINKQSASSNEISPITQLPKQKKNNETSNFPIVLLLSIPIILVVIFFLLRGKKRKKSETSS